jgi:hypothetical protein
VTASAGASNRFDPETLGSLDEPVRRYLTHAISEGALLPDGVRLTMVGRIKVGVWLPFGAEEELDGRSFEWRARVGAGPLTVLTAVDRFRGDEGSTTVRLLGRARVVAAHDENTTRSAAGRAAAEAIWCPSSLLPERGVDWRCESDELIVATWSVPPERPELSLRIDDRGALVSCSVPRWGKAGRATYGYIACGGGVHAERRFGDLVLPSHLTVGWEFDTPRYVPFFEARIVEAAPLR